MTTGDSMAWNCLLPHHQPFSLFSSWIHIYLLSFALASSLGGPPRRECASDRPCLARQSLHSFWSSSCRSLPFRYRDNVGMSLLECRIIMMELDVWDHISFPFLSCRWMDADFRFYYRTANHRSVVWESASVALGGSKFEYPSTKCSDRESILRYN